jgi:hypothetical protein
MECLLIGLVVALLLERNVGFLVIVSGFLGAMLIIPGILALLFMVGFVAWWLWSMVKGFFTDLRIVFLTPAAAAPMTAEQRGRVYRSEEMTCAS